MTKWMRHRFHANADDYRPVTFPPAGPYWCSGYGEDYSVVVAFLPVGVPVTDYWPEASDLDSEPHDGPPTYTTRFPRPEWWTA